MSLQVMLVDDEALARMRLRSLLAEVQAPSCEVVHEAAHAQDVLQWLHGQRCDLLLLDIGMPGMDGLALAQAIAQQPQPPAVIFVTAHSEHALTAFDLQAVDYLTKPVRRERLQQALLKAERWLQGAADAAVHEADGANDALLIHERGRLERVPLVDVLYLKAELKYVTVRTATKAHIYDGSLSDLESRYASRFVRVHRNALVARAAIRAIEKALPGADGDGEGWQVSLQGLDERLSVSRRQLSALREALAANPQAARR